MRLVEIHLKYVQMTTLSFLSSTTEHKSIISQLTPNLNNVLCWSPRFVPPNNAPSDDSLCLPDVIESGFTNEHGQTSGYNAIEVQCKGFSSSESKARLRADRFKLACIQWRSAK